MQNSNVSVVQGIRSIGMGASIDMPGLGTDVDIIDVHIDRLYPAPMFVWLDNHGWPGQSSKSGRFRIMHSSMESGSDDVPAPSIKCVKTNGSSVSASAAIHKVFRGVGTG